MDDGRCGLPKGEMGALAAELVEVPSCGNLNYLAADLSRLNVLTAG